MEIKEDKGIIINPQLPITTDKRLRFTLPLICKTL